MKRTSCVEVTGGVAARALTVKARTAIHQKVNDGLRIVLSLDGCQRYHLIEPVAIQPVSSGSTEVSHRMNGTRRDEQFLARLRVVNLAADLELHSSVDHHHDFVRAVDEILPAAARRINPDSAAETPLRPVCFDSFLIHQFINSCWVRA